MSYKLDIFGMEYIILVSIYFSRMWFFDPFQIVGFHNNNNNKMECYIQKTGVWVIIMEKIQTKLLKIGHHLSKFISSRIANIFLDIFVSFIQVSYTQT